MRAVSKNSILSIRAVGFIFFILISILISTSYSQNILTIETSTKSTTCTKNSDCVSTTSLCVEGQCVACASNSQCDSKLCEDATGKCIQCTSQNENSCDTKYCNTLSGVCEACPNNDACSTGRCSNGVCSGCASNLDCSAGKKCNTNTGICVACNSDFDCELGECYYPGTGSSLCQSCVNRGCSLSGYACDATTGKCSCRSVGESVPSPDACCTKNSISGICTLCILDSQCPSGSKCQRGACVCGSDDYVCQQTLGRDAVASVVLGTPSAGKPNVIVSEVVVQETRKVIIDPLIEIFGWSRVKTETSRSCIKGGACFSSADCCGNECSEGACICSVNACVTSGDCCSGYCDGGLCKQPPTMSLFLTDAFSKPLDTNVGCAGLVDECLPGEGNCVSVCSGITGVFILISLAIGFLVWRIFNHPVPGLVGVFIPILLGISTYPFVGVIIGLLIIGLLLSK